MTAVISDASLLARTAAARGAVLDDSPGWTVGWFFFPIANLFKPYQTFKALASKFAGVDPGLARTIRGWWTTWILFNVAAQIDSQCGLAGAMQAMANIVSSALGIVAAGLCVQVIRGFQAAIDGRIR